MNDLAQHLIISIQKDAQALCVHGGLTKQNLFLIESILRDPARDYNIVNNNAPPAYTTSKHASDVQISDKPFLPPRPSEPRQLPPRPRVVDSPIQTKPPVPVSAKPISSDKLSSQYRTEQEKKNNQFQINQNPSNQNAYASKLSDKVATGAASGLGWGVGMGMAKNLL